MFSSQPASSGGIQKFSMFFNQHLGNSKTALHWRKEGSPRDISEFTHLPEIRTLKLFFQGLYIMLQGIVLKWNKHT